MKPSPSAMIIPRPSRLIAVLGAVASLATLPCSAADTPPGSGSEKIASDTVDGPRTLTLDPGQKLESMHTMIGITTTTIFYKILDQAAVVTVRFDNTKPNFPASLTVDLFKPGTDAEAIDKWVNNQHSDGLFGDAPNPVFTEKLPDGTVVVGEIKPIGKETSQRPDGAGNEFMKNEVGFSVKEFKHAGGKFILKPLVDKTTVYQKTGG